MQGRAANLPGVRCRVSLQWSHSGTFDFTSDGGGTVEYDRATWNDTASSSVNLIQVCGSAGSTDYWAPGNCASTIWHSDFARALVDSRQSTSTRQRKLFANASASNITFAVGPSTETGQLACSNNPCLAAAGWSANVALPFVCSAAQFALGGAEPAAANASTWYRQWSGPAGVANPRSWLRSDLGLRCVAGPLGFDEEQPTLLVRGGVLLNTGAVAFSGYGSGRQTVGSGGGVSIVSHTVSGGGSSTFTSDQCVPRLVLQASVTQAFVADVALPSESGRRQGSETITATMTIELLNLVGCVGGRGGGSDGVGGVPYRIDEGFDARVEAEALRQGGCCGSPGA